MPSGPTWMSTSPAVWCASCQALARPAAVSAPSETAIATAHRRYMWDNEYADGLSAAKFRRPFAQKPCLTTAITTSSTVARGTWSVATAVPGVDAGAVSENGIGVWP